MKLFLKGIFLSIFIVALDQLHKWYMLDVVKIAEKKKIGVLPFFDLVMVWNKGISFGIGQSAESAPLIFSIIALSISAGLLIWMYKCQSALLTFSLSLIIGGAIGNVIDRLRFHAVADFFDLHVAGYHWPAFNIADSAVFIGAVMLFIESFITTKAKEKNAKKK